MSTITTINGSDTITSSRTVINTNFSNLNTDKIETSTLDTDTTLAANSDSKIATQKAVKTYVDAGGNVNASETSKGIVEEATDAEVTAGTATGGTGAKLFVTPAKLATRISAFTYLSSISTGSTTYDLSTASGTQNIAHGLGVSPKLVRITGIHSSNSGSTSSYYSSQAFTTYCNSTQVSSSLFIKATNSSGTGYAGLNTQTFLIRTSEGSNDYYQVGTVTVSSTNISISWTKNGSPTGTVNLIWEAIV